jgi:hypothetical protein
LLSPQASITPKWAKIMSIMVVKLGAVALAVAAIFSVLKIAFGS